MQKLKGKVALVTGGGRGIGRAICEAFAQEGALVGVLDLKQDVALEAVHAIQAAGGQAVALVGNVAIKQDVEHAVEQLRQHFGAPAILVNNAMWNRYGPLMEQTESMIDRMIDVGLKGVVWGYQAVLNDMIQAGGGSIINIGSPSSVLAMRHGVMYSAIKSAVSGLTRSGAAEFGEYNIRVNAIAPSSTPTEGAKLVVSEEAWERRRQRIPLGRLCSAQDVAKAAVFLASEDSSFISGDVLFVDGASTYAFS
ncbi:glucose 1-dehydrogenase [Acinetobacter qingfengensis]|uniref:Oxidoreductase n=1 Tax=Acinetobacter qingfengensis TaxID=1262585 RepID=A0A1E7RCE1_9GAMM|nr:glucose 1-dehydrogenase [Acinetobacter qingfengensis]KAA8735064.1 glucose 1-dehydrogenase [Acinetobacter qingfengensis]OEY97018.1 oxidoreductase [Acinetobacter qingfengensis]